MVVMICGLIRFCSGSMCLSCLIALIQDVSQLCYILVLHDGCDLWIDSFLFWYNVSVMFDSINTRSESIGLYAGFT